MTLVHLLKISLSLISHTFIIYNNMYLHAYWEMTDVKDVICSYSMTISIVITNNYWFYWLCIFPIGISSTLPFTCDNTVIYVLASHYLLLLPTSYSKPSVQMSNSKEWITLPVSKSAWTENCRYSLLLTWFTGTPKVPSFSRGQ